MPDISRILDEIDDLTEEPGPDAARRVPAVKVGDVVNGMEIIHIYTRAQALEDGVLVHVPAAINRKAGISLALALDLTAAAWEDCVAWDDADNDRKGTIQDQDGRLWDVVRLLRIAMGRNLASRTFLFEVRRVPRTGRERWPREVALLATLSRDENGDPTCTISLPHEG